jgi:uncharacterized protein YjdB
VQQRAVPAEVGSVTISGAPAEDALLVGQVTPLSAAVRDAAGNALGLAITWTTTDNFVATVNPAGFVTPIGTGIVGVVARAGMRPTRCRSSCAARSRCGRDRSPA